MWKSNGKDKENEEMAIIKEKIKLTIPEGLTQKGEITVDNAKNNAKVIVTGKTVGAQEVSVQYNGGEIKKTTITVTPTPAFAGEPTASPTAVEVGADATVTATFNVDGVQPSQVKVIPSTGLTYKNDGAVSGKTWTGKFTGKTPGAQNVQLQFGGVTKTVNITVNALPVISGEPQVSKTPIEIDEDVTVTLNFDKAGVKVGEVQVTPSEGLTQKVAPAVSGTKLTVTYTGKTAGAQTVTFELRGVSKTANIVVNAAAVLKSVAAEPSSVTQGQDSTITMQF